ncbi:MAG: exodeoxyribonuclease VII small subunit [Bacteroidaceae bacterium]|nr:exodeoxyribonuclease VII small subunit [Bacteroidaceae bacterium]MBR7167093.1 exodeoxyribonuclease VII small subunit [Bacteroidaceae bacterium]
MENKKELSYGEAIAQLEEIIVRIQESNTDIDSLTSLLARAQELITFCRGRLTEVDENIKALLDEFSYEAPQH